MGPGLIRRYSSPQAARRLGITSGTLRRWIRAGLIAADRTPTGRWVVRADVVEAAVARRTRSEA